MDGEIYGKTAEDCISWEAEWRNDDVNMSAENQCDVDLSLEVRIQAVCKYTNCTEDGQNRGDLLPDNNVDNTDKDLIKGLETEIFHFTLASFNTRIHNDPSFELSACYKNTTYVIALLRLKDPKQYPGAEQIVSNIRNDRCSE